jgi:hypothetical protein
MEGTVRQLLHHLEPWFLRLREVQEPRRPLVLYTSQRAPPVLLAESPSRGLLARKVNREVATTKQGYVVVDGPRVENDTVELVDNLVVRVVVGRTEPGRHEDVEGAPDGYESAENRLGEVE